MFDSGKIYRVTCYLVNLRNTQCCEGYNYYAVDQSDAIAILDRAWDWAESANYQASVAKKEQNSFRRAARKAGDQARSLIQDCTLLFIIKDGWFPATQRQAVDSSVRAAKNAFRAHPELREAA